MGGYREISVPAPVPGVRFGWGLGWWGFATTVKLVDLLGFRESVEGSAFHGLGIFQQQILVLAVEVEDLEKLGVRVVDEFLGIVKGGKALGLQTLEVVERLVESRQDCFLVLEQLLIGRGLLCLQPSIFLQKEGVHFLAELQVSNKDFPRFHA